jgi:hypothetical protein
MPASWDEFESSLRELLLKALEPMALAEGQIGPAAHQLRTEVEAAARSDGKGKSYAPDQYTLTLHPGQVAVAARSTHKIQEALASGMAQVLQSGDMVLVRGPHFTLATDPTLAVGDVRVIAWHSRDPIVVASESTPGESSTEKPPDGAFFMVGGKRYFRLNRVVINIGRRLDNHLVLDDPHVSRQHAQLRAHRGHYILRDLNSTAGTTVNGRLVKEQELHPGDVIGVASLELIYGEDVAGVPDETPSYTPPFSPPSDRDRVTPLNLRIVDTRDKQSPPASGSSKS